MRAAALLLALCLPAARGAGRVPRPTLDVMHDLSVRRDTAEKELLAGRDGPELRGALEALSGLYAELRSGYRPYYGGDEAAWVRFCEDSRGALRDVASGLDRGDGAGARRAFFRLAEIRERAHEEFKPGLLKRLSRLFHKGGRG